MLNSLRRTGLLKRTAPPALEGTKKFYLFLDTGFVVDADTEEAAIHEAERMLGLALADPNIVLDWAPELD